jgi:hypothetical protein
MNQGNSTAESIADIGELSVGIAADELNSADANDNDEGQHDGVLDGGGTIFTVEEIRD